MLGRLGEANKLMQQIVNGANKNLAAVESGLSTRVGELQNVIAHRDGRDRPASQQVAARSLELKAFSEGHAARDHRAGRQLDDQGSSLSDVTQASTAALMPSPSRLEQVEARVGKALAERQEALEQLHGLIANRTDDVEFDHPLLRGADRGLAEPAEARARQIGARAGDIAPRPTTRRSASSSS